MNLSFRLGKIPVRIAPSFFVMTVLLGMSGTDLRVLVAWIAIVFVSVLVHELGHATMGLAFGLEPKIDLHGMGGTTSWAVPRELSTARRIAISLAGPGAGFAAAALVRFGIGPAAFPPAGIGAFVYRQLLAVNFEWGILNLLPMLPLDGGNVMAQGLNALTGGRGERAARVVSIAVAGLAIVAAALFQSWWGALLAISFVATNWRGLKELSAREHDAPMQAALKLAHDALDAKDGALVLELARPVALGSRSAPVRAEALHLLAFGFLLESRVADADAAIAALPKGYSPHPSLLELRASLAGS
jgi:Zn-dependent protease